MKFERAKLIPLLVLTSSLLLSACQTEKQVEQTVKPDPQQLHNSLITLDSHVDISREYMREDAFDPGKATTMKVDFNKMRQGGLDAVVFVVYVAQKKRDEKGYQAAYDAAIKKFTALRKMIEIYPVQISLALAPSDVPKIAAQDKLIAIIGVENGFTIGKDLNKINEFYNLGARYMGLTHSGHNDICDSSAAKISLNDKPQEHGGVSAFGKTVIKRMNQLGMMIDISHASDQCVEQALKLSKAPIIASHSGARALLDHARNLPDHLIKAISDKGGVVQLVGYSGFIKKDPQRVQAYADMKVAIAKTFNVDKFEYKYHEHTPEFANGMVQLNKDFPLASVSQFVDQIVHVIKIAGIDHVGISSDFDGGGELNGWKDASESENITSELLNRGYTKEQIQKIWSGNFLRAWSLISAQKK